MNPDLIPPYKEFCPKHGILEATGTQPCTEHLHGHFDLLEWPGSGVGADVVLVCVHAFGLSAKAYGVLGTRFGESGVQTLALDLRGFGERRGQSGYRRVDFADCVVDIRHLLRKLRLKSPNTKVVLVGESMGGAIVLRVAAQSPELVDGVITSAPAWRLFHIPSITARGLIDRVTGQPGYATRWVVEHATTSDELRDYWFYGGNTRLDLSLYEAYSYLLFMHSTPGNAKKIENTPVLVVQGLYDRLSRPSASAGVFRLLTTEKKQLLIAAHSEHVVLEEDQLKDDVFMFLSSWIDTQVLASEAQSCRVDSGSITVLGESQIKGDDSKEVDNLIRIASKR